MRGSSQEGEGIIAFAGSGGSPLLHSLQQETGEVTAPKQDLGPQGDPGASLAGWWELLGVGAAAQSGIPPGAPGPAEVGGELDSGLGTPARLGAREGRGTDWRGAGAGPPLLRIVLGLLSYCPGLGTWAQAMVSLWGSPPGWAQVIT